jgi:hypothetical protein
MSAKMWVWILFGCSLCIQMVVAAAVACSQTLLFLRQSTKNNNVGEQATAADDIEGESLTQSQSLPSFVHQISKSASEFVYFMYSFVQWSLLIEVLGNSVH